MKPAIAYLREAELVQNLFERDMNAELLYSSFAERAGENPELRKIAQRINKARAIVYQVGQRFLKTNTPEQRRELFRFVYGKTAQNVYEARTNGIAIELQVSQEELKEEGQAEAKGKVITGNEAIDTVLERAELCTGKANTALMGPIAYMLEYGQRDIDTTRKHELKHVMDNIIGTDLFYKEMSADLYSGITSLDGIARDVETAKTKLAREETALARMIAMHVPPKAKERQEQTVQKLNKDLLAAHLLPIECIEPLARRITPQLLSFVISLAPTDQLGTRLNELTFQL